MTTPTRQQLAKFLGNDHDVIRQFETLFNTVATPTTATATEPEIQIETAGNEALARIERLERAFQMLELAPRSPTISEVAAASHSHDAGSGKLLQDIIQMGSTGTTTSVVTDFAPTITQGREVASVAITPTSIGSKIIVRAKVRGTLNASYNGDHAALFKSDQSACLTYDKIEMLTANWHVSHNLLYSMTTTSLDAITFSLRTGSSNPGTHTTRADSWLEVQEVAE